MAPAAQLHEPYAHLYIGNYFADTLHLSAEEHCALRLLLLETWVHGLMAGHDAALAAIAGLTPQKWDELKPAVLPLLMDVRPRILESVGRLRASDGQRLPAAEWEIVRSIVFERDGYVCLYCGSTRDLEGDHIVPLCRGGSNAFRNLATACRGCNQAKGSRTLAEWQAALLL
jgi:hypothetical protein